jgi:hypothetical protein
MPDEHLNANRVWTLIRDSEQFTAEEASHMPGCKQCADWITSFAAMARKAGFKVAFTLPDKGISAD